MGDAWCARRHPFFLLFFELEKIEIEAAIRNFLGARESLSEIEKSEKPGGSASAFCAPVSMTSMPSASMSILIPENDETVSRMRTTSGYFARTPQISPSGFITPVEVSL